MNINPDLRTYVMLDAECSNVWESILMSMHMFALVEFIVYDSLSHMIYDIRNHMTFYY